MLQSAVELYPAKTQLVLRLGTAYLRIGKVDEGLAILKGAVEKSPDAGTKNYVALEFANAGKELEAAERYAGEVILKTEEESRDTSLDRLEMSDLRRTQNLGAYWDTLGWIYFKQGRLDLAEKFVAASWTMTQQPVVGDHLGQIYERQGRRQEAQHLYALSLAAGNNDKSTRDRLKRLVVGQANVDPAVNKAREELGQLRSVVFHFPFTKSISAEFFILFSPGSRVEDVRFISGSEELKSAKSVIANSLFKMPFPDNTPTRIVRRGVAYCGEFVKTCQVVLLTPDSVNSLQ